MTAEITTIVGQLNIAGGKWRSNAPNQIAVREPKADDIPGAGKGDLFVVAEIQGDIANRDILEQQLAQTIRDNYYLSRGSVTASLRRAMQAAGDLLYHRNQQTPLKEQVVGGAVALVTTHEDAFVAQIGPAAFFAVLGNHIRRYPARSAWLDEAMAPTQDNTEPALGLNNVIEPNLHHLRLSLEDRLVLADSRLAGQLPLKELVRAVDSGNVKTATKNLAKIARAKHCSAIVLEAIEVKSTAIGPLKIPAPPQLSNLFNRRRGQSTNKETAAAQPVKVQTVAEAPGAQPLEPAIEGQVHASTIFTSTSIMQKPLEWWGAFTRKSGAQAPVGQPIPQDDEDIAYYQPAEDNDMMPEVEDYSTVMDSMAAESPFRSEKGKAQSAVAVLAGKKIFRVLAMGVFMLVALLGGGLKNILTLLLPGAGSQQSPRLAGTQAQRQSYSASSWTLLRNVAIAIPILVAVIVTVNYLQKGRIREAEYNEFVATAQTKFEQAQAVEPTSALGLMTEAEAALVQAEQIKTDQPEISELRRQMAEEADKVGNVHRLYYLPQLRQYTDAGAKLNSIVVQGLEVYVMDAGNDRIFHHRLDDAGEALQPDDETVIMVSRGQAVENVAVSDLLAMTWMPTGGSRQTSDLVILNSTGLLEYNPNWGITTSALAGTETLALPVAVDSYFGNFYVLDPQANALLRYLPTLDGYSAPPESYFSAEQAIDLTNAVDVAIDGSIYILFKDGNISKYLSGQPVVEFSVTGLDKPLNNPVSLFTAPNEEVQHLYIADAGNQRIVQLNKDGSFVRQFKPRAGEAISFATLQDIFVDEIGEKMYILDSNNLYLTNLPSE